MRCLLGSALDRLACSLTEMSISSWSASAGIPVQLHANEVQFMHARITQRLKLKHGKFGPAKLLQKYVHDPSSNITIHAN